MNAVDQRCLSLIKILKQSGKERYIYDVYEKIGILEQNVHNIKNGRNHFTVNHIYNFRKHYGVSLEWIFGFSDEVYINNNSAKIVQNAN